LRKGERARAGVGAEGEGKAASPLLSRELHEGLDPRTLANA